MKKVLRTAAAAAIALSFAVFSPASTATAEVSCYRYKGAERDFVRKMNLARSAAGVHRLSLDKQLSKVARRHSWEMKRKNSLYHTPNSKLAWRVTRWNMLGENVGVGGSVASLHQAFMNSPGHRANIVKSSYRHVGVGVHTKGDYIWVTVVFEARRDPGTRLRMCR